MKTLLVVAAFCAQGCVSMTPVAAGVMLHQQYSALLDKCQRLGPVVAEASAWTNDKVNQQAMNNLRDAAARKYLGADSVALVNVDEYVTRSVANGIAFKCN